VSLEQLRFRRAAVSAFACAALNAGAALAMVLFLAPGLMPSSQRLDFIREYSTPWRAAWGLWIVTALSLAVFYAALRGATGGPRAAVWIAVAGLVPDIGAEVIYIAAYPTLTVAALPRFDRLCALLSATLGNGAYTVVWHVLSRGMPFRALAWPGIAAGYGMALAGILYWPPGLIAATAVAIPSFTLWCVLVGCFFWKKARAAVTMPPHA
jgi:hypothetical protein